MSSVILCCDDIDMRMKVVAPIFLALLVTACDHTATPEYLMRHPNVLEREVQTCDVQATNSVYCKMVFNTRSMFVNLIDEMQSDPEAFGQSILDLEMQTAQLRDAVQQAKQKLDQTKPDASDYAAVKENYRNQQIKLDNHLENINAHLAVVGLASPG